MIQIITGKIKSAQKVVVYGPEGIGKSTFAASFPEALFIDTEGSTTHMNVVRTQTPTSWTMLNELIKDVKSNPTLCKTLVLDTADWAEILCCNFICSRAQVKGIEDFGYGKGYTYLEEEFGKLLNLLTEIISVGINVVITAHAQMRKFEQPDEMGAYDRFELKFAAEQPYYPDAPKEPVSASDLIKQQQDILARNGENERKRRNVAYIESKHSSCLVQIQNTQREIDILKNKLNAQTVELNEILADLETARKSALDLHDESTAELEENLRQIEEINAKVRKNLDKDKAEEDANGYADQYTELTGQIDTVRQEKLNLLQGANLPLPGLSVVDGELTYNGFKWDNMSGADQLIVSTAIVRKLNPECGFVLMDKLEQMDIDELHKFGAWLEAEGLQAIATRVSTGDECSIIIEDGYVAGAELPADPEIKPTWKAGSF